MSSRDVKTLDRALATSTTPSDEELAAMVAMGSQIRDAFEGLTPAHSPQRAMFVRAVADGNRPGPMRFVVPAAVTAVLLIGVVFMGRTALPGGVFYPVREALRTVGLAPASVEEVQKLISGADRLIDRAERIDGRHPEAAERLAFEAARVIGMAEGAFADLEVDERASVADELADVLARAKAILTEEAGEDVDRDVDAQAARNGHKRNGNQANGNANRNPGNAKNNGPRKPRNARARARGENRAEAAERKGTNRRATRERRNAAAEERDDNRSQSQTTGDGTAKTMKTDDDGTKKTDVGRIGKGIPADDLGVPRIGRGKGPKG